MPNSTEIPTTFITRRKLLATAMLAGTTSMLPAGPLLAQGAVLPLNTPGLDHLDVIVPDVAATAKFWMGVLNTHLHAQPFRGGFRYFVLLGEVNEAREVGYLAIGDSAGRGQYIGHFCTSVYDWRQNSQAIFSGMAEAFAAAGFGEFPGSTGIGGIFADPDGLEIQFLPAPDTLVTAAVPSDLVEWNKGLVIPHGVDHVVLQVSNLERAVGYYRILYGQEAGRDGDRAWFGFPASDTTLILEQSRYEYGLNPKIARFGIKVDPFDTARVSAGLLALGATLLDSDKPGALRFADNDGNVAELVPV
jgi:catechol 2,3-dioxygenase-like lactoylglutathione lyase family enzyme